MIIKVTLSTAADTTNAYGAPTESVFPYENMEVGKCTLRQYQRLSFAISELIREFARNNEGR